MLRQLAAHGSLRARLFELSRSRVAMEMPRTLQPAAAIAAGLRNSLRRWSSDRICHCSPTRHMASFGDDYVAILTD